ncbi:hypothetical protein JCM10908_006840 [Rhodotorula pacifica]|uniref:uncharacterized protein n=1 Tax=Rhodotorula pacifica TaxID=1495444 RepID=UPI003181715D
MPSSPAESASPAPTASLMCLPNELLEKVIEHLVPLPQPLPQAGEERRPDPKPLDAIRLGTACRRLHDLNLQICDGDHSNSWLADCLAEYGHHVTGLSIRLPYYSLQQPTLLAVCVQNCVNRCSVRVRGASFDPAAVTFVLAPIASTSVRKLEISSGNHDVSVDSALASLICRSDGLQTLVLDFSQTTEARAKTLANAWQPCAALKHLTARYAYSSLDNFVYGRGVPPLRTLNLTTYNVPMKTLTAFLEAFSATLVELGLRCSADRMHMANDEKPDSPVLLPKCTTLTTATVHPTRNIVCIVSALIHPETPLTRITYTATYDKYDVGMIDAIKTFHAKQAVKTLRHIRFLRKRNDVATLSGYNDSQKQLKSLRVWGASNGIDVDVDDMRIP